MEYVIDAGDRGTVDVEDGAVGDDGQGGEGEVTLEGKLGRSHVASVDGAVPVLLVAAPSPFSMVGGASVASRAGSSRRTLARLVRANIAINNQSRITKSTVAPPCAHFPKNYSKKEKRERKL